MAARCVEAHGAQGVVPGVVGWLVDFELGYGDEQRRTQHHAGDDKEHEHEHAPKAEAAVPRR